MTRSDTKAPPPARRHARAAARALVVALACLLIGVGAGRTLSAAHATKCAVRFARWKLELASVTSLSGANAAALSAETTFWDRPASLGGALTLDADDELAALHLRLERTAP